MRDRDRFWWAIVPIALALYAAGVVVLILGLEAAPLYTADWDTMSASVQFVVLDLAVVGCGFLAMRRSLHARTRHRLRLAAMGGDASAMALAAVFADASRTSPAAERPLELLWRLKLRHRVIVGLIVGVHGTLGPIWLGLVALELLAGVVWPVRAPVSWFGLELPRPAHGVEALAHLVVASVLAVLVVVVVVLALRYLPVLFGRPFGVMATSEGIEQWTQFGTRVRMAWSEMRLVEVLPGNVGTKRGFAVYAPRKRIWWAEHTGGFGSESRPHGATASEMTLRHRALLDLIAARTGLRPRILALEASAIRASALESG